MRCHNDLRCRKILVLMIAAVSSMAVAHEGWQPTSGPFGGGLYTIIRLHDGSLLGGSDAGVSRSSDNGVSWEVLALQDIQIRELLETRDHVLLAGSGGEEVYRSHDNGRTWLESSKGLAGSWPQALCEDLTGRIYCGLLDGGLFSSTDGGRTWVQAGFAGLPVTAMGVNRNGDLYLDALDSDSSGTFRSTDNGASWKMVRRAGLGGRFAKEFAFNHSGHVFAACLYDNLQRSTDRGVTWQTLPCGGPPASVTIDDVGAISVGNLEYLGVWRSTNNGNTFFPTTLGNLEVWDVTSIGGDDLLAGAKEGTFRSEDGGLSWIRVGKNLPNPATGSASSGHLTMGFAIDREGAVLAACLAGVFRTVDMGESWVNLTENVRKASFSKVAVGPDGTILCVAQTGVFGTELLRSTDGGGSWQTLAVSGLEFQEVFITSRGVCLAGGYGTVPIRRSTDGGVAWSNIPLPVNSSSEAFCENADGTLLASGYGGLFASSDQGLNWRLIDPSHYFISIVRSPRGPIFGLHDNRAILRSIDGGNTWVEVYQGVARSVAVSRLGEVFVGLATPEVFVTVDDGDSWTSTGPGLPRRVGGLICDDRGYVYAAPSLSPVYRLSRPPLPPPAENVVGNPGFEPGTDPWEFFTDGQGSFDNSAAGPGSARAGRVTIGIPGNNVQLYQAAIPLTAGTRYRLTFKAYSSSGHDVQVYIHKHDAPYTSYGLDGWTADLGISWNTFSKEFVAGNFSGTVHDARLRFWLAPFDATGDVFRFDDVVLERCDGTVPPPVVTDQPLNPGFEDGLNHWQFFTDAAATCKDDAPGKDSPHAAHIAVGSKGGNVQLYQTGLRLEPGARYRLTFRAFSNTGHDLDVYVHKHGAPYTGYGLHWSGIDLGPTWKTFSTELTAENVGGGVTDARLRFWLAPYAVAGDHYYVDDVALTKLSPAPRAAGDDEESGYSPGAPEDFSLAQNFPNPFNPSTTISYTLPQPAFVSLKIYNTLGEEVATLVHSEVRAGRHDVVWDARGLASGPYLCRIQAGDFGETRKMLLIR